MIKWKLNQKPRKEIKELVFFTDDKDKTDSASAISIKIEKSDNQFEAMRHMRVAFRSAVSRLKSHKVKDIKVDIKKLAKISNFDESFLTFELIRQFELANYSFDRYKNKKPLSLDSVYLLGADKSQSKEAQSYAKFMLYARDLANTPGSDMTPATLADEAKKLAKKDKKLKVKVLSKKDLQKLGAGALLAVGRASEHEPKMIILEYRGSKKKDVDVLFVGKGITFDSGGLDIKPAGKFTDMNQDMSGGGTALSAVALASELGLGINAVAIVPSAENAVSGTALRPGDILKTMSGKTVEVGHTDAEGRLVLADGITYAKKYKPSLLVTVATLTGAALVALGQEASAVMSKDEEFAWSIREWGEYAGDYSWPLPLWSEYASIMQGTFADLNNVQNKGSQGYGGTVTAGAFLYEFAKETGAEFVHIDMAPRMAPGPNDALSKDGGALGGPVSLLLEIMKRKF